MTPWFAAASGFVLAASLWIYSPHAQLKFPGNAIGEVHCQLSGCDVTPDPRGSGSLATSSGKPLAQRRQPATPARPKPRARGHFASSGVTFGYLVLWDQHDEFAVLITASSAHPVKGWKLSFVLHGDRIREVYGARWQRAGRDGGTASALSGQSIRWPGGGPAGPGDASGTRQHDAFSFSVIGTGAPVLPTSCFYDGAACAFSS